MLVIFAKEKDNCVFCTLLYSNVFWAAGIIIKISAGTKLASKLGRHLDPDLYCSVYGL